MIDLQALLPYAGILWHGLLTTVGLTTIAIALGLLVAMLLAWWRLQAPRAIGLLIQGYVELIRNTPFLVQLLFIYFGLPALGVHLSAVACAVLAMTLNLAAYATDIIRSGIAAIPRGQREAARALGMSHYQIYRYIILLPAMSRMFAALTGQCIIVMLGSAVVSQISVEELTSAASFIQSRNFRSMEAFLTASLCYLALALVMRQGFGWLERRWFAFREGER